tara:strand:+ start:426 stop:557 length:132 start_codon:yes stop_codon:yes gene_type:complete
VRASLPESGEFDETKCLKDKVKMAHRDEAPSREDRFERVIGRE